MADDVNGSACEAAVNRCEAKFPFVELDPDNADCPLSAWSVRETGDVGADIVTGVEYAETLLRRSKDSGPLMVRMALQAVLEDMVKKGAVGPIEHGFLFRIAMAAAVGSQN
jgi:hypothetical protein